MGGEKYDDLCWNLHINVDFGFFSSDCETTLGSYHDKMHAQQDATFEFLVNDVGIREGHSAWNLKVNDMCPNRCQQHVSKKICNYKHPCLKDGATFVKDQEYNCDLVNQWIEKGDITDVCSKKVGLLMRQYSFFTGNYENSLGNGYSLDQDSETKVQEVCQSTCEKAGQFVCDPLPA